MPFVQAKCPECGGMLAVDDSKKAAMCQFCGEAFIVQEAINHYNTYNTTNHNYGAGSIVNIYGDNSKDFVIEGGVLKKYQGESLTPVIPEGVVAIEGGVFKDSMITKVSLPSTLKELRCYSENPTGGFWDTYSIGPFYGCKYLKEVNLPIGLIDIWDSAFEDCTSLTSMTIPDSVISIGANAFYGCKTLTSVTIGNRVTSIGNYAFSCCTNLTSITIPNAVTDIGTRAFSGCTSLTSITFPDSVKHIGWNAFEGCTSLTDIYISDIGAWCNIEFKKNWNFNYSKAANPFCFAQNLYVNGKLVTDLSILDGFNTNNAFEGWTLYNNFLMKRRQDEEDVKRRTIAERKNKGLCQHCGDTFKGLFSKTCSTCGKPKDY